MQAGGAAAGSSIGAGSNTARASVSFRISIFVENLIVEIPKVTVRGASGFFFVFQSTTHLQQTSKLSITS